MCGIVAFLADTPAPVDADLVRDVSARLRHRGPDDHGLLLWDPAHGEAFSEDAGGLRRELPYTRGTAAPGACVAARRLAIIDRGPAGHQPMLDSRGRAVVLNGEVYNHVELREELAAKGHVFQTRSDTEVVLAAYVEWGAGCLDRFIGMFAFAILDMRAGRVFVARDPFGMKPLFYARVTGGWLFASEIGAMLEATDIPRTANPRRVVDYLTTALTVRNDTETVFAHVHQLPPASYVERALGSADDVLPRRYWRPEPQPLLDVSFEEATALVRDAFLESIRLHLRSDVPVGVILSGGVDSSSVAMAMRLVGGDALDIHTFSYIGEDDAVSEERWIDIVNGAARAIPHKLRLTPEEWAATPRRAFHQGEPSGSLAVFAQNRLYKAASEAGVPVALSGQGGDEVFAGYARHWGPRVASLMGGGDAMGGVRFLSRLRRHRGPSDPTLPRLLAGVATGRWPRARALTDRMRGKRGGAGRLADQGYVARHVVEARPTVAWSGSRALHEDLAHGITDGLLTLLRYEDRSSMEHSVEGRLPYLTRPLVDLVLSLPQRYLVGDDGTCKLVLKEAMRGTVPDDVLDRRVKIGFAVPHRSWIGRMPEVASMLETAAGAPPVAPGVARELAEVMRTPAHVSRADGFAAWRLIGFVDWARDFDVEFD